MFGGYLPSKNSSNSRPFNNASFIELVLQHNGPHYSCMRPPPGSPTQCAQSDLHKRARNHQPISRGGGIGHCPTLFSTLKSYEAVYLAHHVAQFISTPEKEMNIMQKEALERIRSGKYPGLSQRDASLSTPNADMLRLLNDFNLLFFFGGLYCHFSWALMSPDILGQCLFDGSIQMNPLSRSETDVGDDIRSLRVGTLLHEATHALFFQYACESCPTFSVDVVNASGHGRAYMIVTTALEQACKVLFGADISVAGAEDWRANWEIVHCLPSLQDVREWRWVEKELEHRDKLRKASGRTDVVMTDVGTMSPKPKATHLPVSKGSTLVVCVERNTQRSHITIPFKASKGPPKDNQ